ASAAGLCLRASLGGKRGSNIGAVIAAAVGSAGDPGASRNSGGGEAIRLVIASPPGKGKRPARPLFGPIEALIRSSAIAAGSVAEFRNASLEFQASDPPIESGGSRTADTAGLGRD